MMRFAAVVATLLITTLPTLASSQLLSPEMDQMARERIALQTQAYQNGDYVGAAAYMDPESLEGFAQFMRTIMLEMSDKEMTAEDLQEISQLTGQTFESVAEIEALTDQQLFGMMISVMTRVNPMMKDIFQSMQYRIVGILKENDTSAFAVVRTSMQFPGSSERIEVSDVVPLVLRDGEVMIAMKGDLEQMLVSIMQMFEAGMDESEQEEATVEAGVTEGD